MNAEDSNAAAFQIPRLQQRTTIAPVFRSAAFELRGLDEARQSYGQWPHGHGYIYSRLGNPTVAALESALAELEGADEAIATSSGQAATFLVLCSLLRPGDNLIASPYLYGGTVQLLDTLRQDYDIQTKWADPTDPQDILNQVDERTCGIFAETLSNPTGVVPAFREIAAIAQKHAVPFIVDNTLASPCLFRPLQHGATIVLESTTKYINGHGTALGGLVAMARDFPFERFQGRLSPAPARSVNSPKSAHAAFFRARLAQIGSCQSPDNAALTLDGLQTLELRLGQITRNAQTVAECLAGHPAIESVRYAGLKTDPNHRRAQRYLTGSGGGIVLATLRGGQEAAGHVLHHLRVFTHAPSLGQANSLALHPKTTTHLGCTDEQCEQAGIHDGTLRLALGIEAPERLVNDLRQALATLPPPQPG